MLEVCNLVSSGQVLSGGQEFAMDLGGDLGLGLFSGDETVCNVATLEDGRSSCFL